MSPSIQELVRTSQDWTGDAPSSAMLTAHRAFMVAADKNDALIREAVGAMRDQDAAGAAAWIAITLGTLVERGGSPKISGPAVFEELRAWLADLPVFRGGDQDRPESEADPEPALTAGQRRLLDLFKFLCQSVVTHLARLPERREAMFQDFALRERLDELGAWSHGARWVHEALVKSSGTLVVLHVPGSTGLRLRFENVGNCFHLFSLLQCAVGTKLPGGRVPNELVAQVARGKSAEDVSDEAWWHYGSPTSPGPSLDASIWGEGIVREIPRVDGEQVLLLWPPVLQSRTWSGGFLGPHLEAMPADAAIERMLTPDECRAWLTKLGVLPPRKKWWRFWS